MKRLEVNTLTGEQTEIEQTAYLVADAIVVLDATAPAPEGGVVLTEVELQAAKAQADANSAVEIKRKLFAEAVVERDIVLGHLRWFYTEATDELAAANTAVAQAAGNPDLNLPVLPQNEAAIAAAQAALSAAQSARDAVVAKRSAIKTAINSLQGAFNDPRVVAAVNGEVKQVLKTIKNEIGFALAQASPATYLALKALDPL